jgi:hypothetical protein
MLRSFMVYFDLPRVSLEAKVVDRLRVTPGTVVLDVHCVGNPKLGKPQYPKKVGKKGHFLSNRGGYPAFFDPERIAGSLRQIVYEIAENMLKYNKLSLV